MAKLLKLRRGTTTQHGSFTGAEGEVTVDTDKETLVVHDGSTAGGHPVAAEDMANVSSASIAGRLANDSIATTKIAGGALPTDVTVASANIVNGTIVNADLANDCINGSKIADNVINSEHYVDGSIDRVHLAADIVDGSKIADNSINSEHYVDGSIDNAHISTGAVTFNKMQDIGANQILGKVTSGTGDITALTAANVRSMINVENGATADQTAAEIRTLVESASDSNVFTDADHSKLNGIESGATADQTKSDIDGLNINADQVDGLHASSFLRSDASDTATGTLTVRDVKLSAGYHLQRSDHHSGHLEGSYNNVGANSQKSNPIYTIGSSYNPNDASLNNMYGVGYGHGDASFNPSGAGWGFYVAADGDRRLYLDGSNGRLYLGAQDTRYLTDITGQYGSVQINGAGAAGWEGFSIDGRAVFMHDGGTSTGIYNDVDNEWLFYANHNGSSYMYHNNSNKIEATSGGAYISGSLTASGNVTAYSDARLKTNVNTINDALGIVGKLRGVSFDWKESGKHSIGVIAQEVEKVLPEIVLESTATDPETKEETTVKTVDYGKIVGVLINAINELKAEVDELKGGK